MAEETIVAPRRETGGALRNRNSGIDLLRIIAMLIICLAHAYQTAAHGFVDHTAYGLPANIISSVLGQAGNLCNILFIACSSFYLVDAKRSKGSKALNILFDSMLISTVIMIGFLIGGYSFGWYTIVEQIIPDVFANVWFIPVYVVFYLLAPILGAGLRSLSRKGLLAYCLGAFVFYGGLQVLDHPIRGASELVSFFFVFGLVAFYKWHMPRYSKSLWANIIVFCAGMVLAFAPYLLARTVFKEVPFLNKLNMEEANPFSVIALISLANIFAMMKFHNRFISYLGTSSLFVYLIHENYLLRHITRVEFYQLVFERFDKSTFLLWVLVCGLFMFVVGFILAAVYRETFHRGTKWLANKTALGITVVFNAFYKKVYPENQPPSSEE